MGPRADVFTLGHQAGVVGRSGKRRLALNLTRDWLPCLDSMTEVGGSKDQRSEGGLEKIGLSVCAQSFMIAEKFLLIVDN